MNPSTISSTLCETNAKNRKSSNSRTLHFVLTCVFVCVCVCVCVCVYVLLPCSDAIQADLFIRSLICQTRSNAPVTFHRDSFELLFTPQPDTQISLHRHTHTNTHRLFISPKHLQSCRCPPASQNPAWPPL